jgi:ribosome-binding factor A
MATTTHHRVERVSSLLRDVLGELLTRELKDPRASGVVVTDVEISHDLGEAKIFVTGIAPERRKDALRGLQAATGYLRREIGRRVQMRTVPNLRFYFDESLDYGARIDAVLREIGMSGAGVTPGQIPDPETPDGDDGADSE